MTNTESYAKDAWTDGLSIFAAVVLMTVGLFQVIEGIAAIAEDEFLVAGANYVFEFDLTTWGWIHLLVGIVLVVTGGALLAGQTWAVIVGMSLAVASAVVNFAWLPFQPFWAIAIIALDVAVIWALGRLLTAPRPTA
ncbi:DUF7144 family membrane protein [Nocardioides sambongensis]|uniref:DUF7144 family membrane protein n=1 Tax=Nocardioides sambongensis TaxID=2589074 RepID=UPI0018C8B0C9|nr:hypothetical protein [Nocardioides sambongensis]